jgi:polyhydroxybutyrate depolymerase
MRSVRLLTTLVALVLTISPPASGATQVAERAPVPSEGCGDASDAIRSDGLEVAAETRRWRSFVPTTYDGAAPLPLVLWLHGQGMSAASVEEWADLVPFAEEHDFVVIAPEGHAPDSGWMWEPDVSDIPLTTDNRDIAFIDALLDSLSEELCLDLARVYATGFSMGGHGVMALACALDDRIAAVAPAAMFSDLGAACAPERLVPVLAIAQTADDVVFWDGGLGDFLADRLPWGTTKGDEPFFQRPAWSLSELERAEAMALRNGCDPGPESEALAEAVTRMIWRCPADSPVELIVVEGGDHSWMIDTAPVSASDLMWAFFERFALP